MVQILILGSTSLFQLVIAHDWMNCQTYHCIPTYIFLGNFEHLTHTQTQMRIHIRVCDYPFSDIAGSTQGKLMISLEANFWCQEKALTEQQW